MKTNRAKGGRKSSRKGLGRARSKAARDSSVLPSAEIVQALTFERQRLIFALRGALHFYDRASGTIRSDHGWTAKDMAYLNEIRDLAWGSNSLVRVMPQTPVPGVSLPRGGQTPPESWQGQRTRENAGKRLLRPFSL